MNKKNNENLENLGIKQTKQRNLILNILKQANVPISVEEIYLMLIKNGNIISFSTIYRSLEVFVSKGLVVKSNITDDNKAMFELNRMEHEHHLVCIRCKKITMVDNCPLEGYEKALEQRTKHQITAHKLELFGFCPLCQEKEGEIQT